LALAPFGNEPTSVPDFVDSVSPENSRPSLCWVYLWIQMPTRCRERLNIADLNDEDLREGESSLSPRIEQRSGTHHLDVVSRAHRPETGDSHTFLFENVEQRNAHTRIRSEVP